MKVNIIGFELTFGSNLKISEVFQILESKQGKKNKFYSDEYVYYVDVKDDYIIGVALRLKKDKNSVRTKEQGGTFIPTIDVASKDTSNTEVSFFCMNPETLKGVCYSYFGGLSTAMLRTIWQPAFKTILNAKRKAYRKELVGSGKYQKKKASELAEQKYYEKLSIRTLITKAGIDSLFDKLASIKEIEINSQNALSQSGKYETQSSFIKKSAVNVKFENAHARLQEVQEYVRKILPSKVSEGDIIRLRGEIDSGEEKKFYLGENNQEFGDFNFDEYTKKFPKKDWAKFPDCDAIGVLLKILKKDTILFGLTKPEHDWRLPSAKTVNKVKSK